MTDNPILVKSEDFAVEMIMLYKELIAQKAYSLADQLLRCSTSIGANASEAVFGQSLADFHSKFCISLKEANETRYWLRLLYRSEYITEDQFKDYNAKCEELIRILVAITKNSKKQAQHQQEKIQPQEEVSNDYYAEEDIFI